MTKRKRTAAWLPRVAPAEEQRADPDESDRRRALIGLDEQAAGIVRDLFAREDLDAAGVMEAFYERLFQFGEIRQRLSDSASRERLRTAQAVHRDAMVVGDFGEGYVRDRRWAGELHWREGLEPSWYLAAVSRTIEELARQLATADTPAESLETLTTVVKAALFDVGLVLEAYHQAQQEESQHTSDQRAELSQAAIALTRALTGGDVLSEAVRWGMRLIGADAACVATRTLDMDGFEDVRIAGLSEGSERSLSFPNDPQTHEVLALPTRVVFSGANEASTHPLSDTLRDDGMQSSVHVALVEGASPAGAALFLFQDAAAPSAEQLAMIGEFVRLVAAVLSGARRHEEAVDLASTDALTGLANRRSLSERLDLERRRARSFAKPFSVLALDLDHFKRVNDSHGHGAGDAVLKSVALGLIDQLRDVDLAARVGGDELVVVLPNCDDDAAVQVAERIRQHCADSSLVIGEGATQKITLSVGAATYPTSGDHLEDLLRRADEALYAAKRAGRNRVLHYREVLSSRLDDNPSLVTEFLNEDPTGALPLLAAIELRAPSLLDHSVRVADVCSALASELGLRDAQVDVLGHAALLHDLGLVGMPATMLDDDGVATADWETMSQHAVIGARLIDGVEALRAAAPGIRHHHERFDGGGHPAGLSGETIPIEARIIAVADSYVALISDVPGRSGLSEADAKEIIVAQAGKSFDPAVTDALVRVLSRRESRRPRRAHWLEVVMDPTLIHDTIAPEAKGA